MRVGFRGTLWLSLLAAVGLSAGLVLTDRDRRSGAEGSAETLVLYCAAGLQPPVSEILARYESIHQVSFQTKFAGSGALLSDIRVGGGDLFVAADQAYLLEARRMNLVNEILPIAAQSPVIVVAKGNPKHIGTLDDLLRGDVQLSLADPKLAAIGQVVAGLLDKDGRWQPLLKKAAIQRDTVNQVANDVKLGAADAGIVWDATAIRYADLEMVHVPVFDQSKNEIAVGVLAASDHPVRAWRFARYLTTPDQGLRVFAKYGYQVEGPPVPASPAGRRGPKK